MFLGKGKGGGTRIFPINKAPENLLNKSLKCKITPLESNVVVFSKGEEFPIPLEREEERIFCFSILFSIIRSLCGNNGRYGNPQPIPQFSRPFGFQLQAMLSAHLVGLKISASF